MSTDHHRKIDLQSPADLTYLQTNIKTSAQQKLDLAIPPPAISSIPTAAQPEEDSFRPQVQSLIQDYVTRTLSLALPSLAINGLDADKSMLVGADESTVLEDESNYEAYDPRLAEKLRTLYRQLEWEHTRVAELRREAPGAAARAYEERLQLEMEEDKRRAGEVEGEVMELVGKREGGLEEVRLERGEEVEMMWGRGLEGLVEMGKVTEVVARMERAGKAAGVVEGM
ncbi:MAG: hypothetical protein Q9220_002090 [cf. Caloplaca sp. 1 TL-2023]